MKQIMQKSLSIALLISALVADAAPTTVPTAPVVNAIKLRPQSLNGARKVSGEVPGSAFTHLPDMDEWYAEFWVAPEYQKSFRPSSIACELFGEFLQDVKIPATNGCPETCGQSIVIQGTHATGTLDPKAWRANDFYLSDSYNGSLTFKPVISNFIVDFNFYAGFDEWAQGLYFRVYAPFVHTKWNLHMKETFVTPGEGAGTHFLSSASDFFAGKTAPAFSYNTPENPPIAGAVQTPVTLNPLNFHKISGTVTVDDNCCEQTCGGLTKNGFGEIRGELGWDFWASDDYHIGLYLAGAAPTGNKPSAQYLFSPVVGNGKHWELGGGLTAHWTFWRSEDEENHVGLYTDMMVTHLFNAREQRVFDLNNKPLSRYMLAAKMTTNVSNGLGGTKEEHDTEADNVQASKYQFANEFTPVANLTAQDINVSIGAQVDLTAWFNYTSGGFTWDFGYNLWLQTCERYGCESKCGPALATDKNTWVLIGNAVALGQGEDDQVIYPLAFSDSKASLALGNAPTGGFGFTNANIDASLFAVNHPQGDTEGYQALIDVAGHTDENDQPLQMKLSVPPTFLSTDDINLEQKSRGLTNKVWTSVGWRWDREGAVPFFGVGGEAEFGSSACAKECEKPVTPNNCVSCLNGSISQWGVWAKVGVSFD